MSETSAKQDAVRKQKLKDFHHKVKLLLKASDRDFLYR